jgi:hypothetical protein
LQRVLEGLSLGVMEYWNVEKRAINPLVITPTLHYPNISILIEIKSSQDGLPSSGL